MDSPGFSILIVDLDNALLFPEGTLSQVLWGGRGSRTSTPHPPESEILQLDLTGLCYSADTMVQTHYTANITSHCMCGALLKRVFLGLPITRMTVATFLDSVSNISHGLLHTAQMWPGSGPTLCCCLGIQFTFKKTLLIIYSPPCHPRCPCHSFFSRKEIKVFDENIPGFFSI